MNSNVRHPNRRGIIFSAATDFSFFFAKDYSIEKMEKFYTYFKETKPKSTTKSSEF